MSDTQHEAAIEAAAFDEWLAEQSRQLVDGGAVDAAAETPREWWLFGYRAAVAAYDAARSGEREEAGGKPGQEKPPGPDSRVPRNRIEWDYDAVGIQRDDLRERLDRIRAAITSDAELLAASPALRSFLLKETRDGWVHVTDAMIERLRATGTHHEEVVDV